MIGDVINIEINLSDILTRTSCAVLVCELIKYLIYQREQIPYTYERLKYLITKRKELMSKVSNLYFQTSLLFSVYNNVSD